MGDKNNENNPKVTKIGVDPNRELTDADFELLRDHVRMQHGIKPVAPPKGRPEFNLRKPPKFPIKSNRAYELRQQVAKRKVEGFKIKQSEKVIEELKILRKKNNKEIPNYKTNKCSELRARVNRGEVILTERVRDNLKKECRPPWVANVNPDKNCVDKQNRYGQNDDKKCGPSKSKRKSEKEEDGSPEEQ